MQAIQAEAEFTVIAGYRFFDLERPREAQQILRSRCRDLGLKGTILLSHEGINSYVSGSAEAIRQYKNLIHEELQFPTIDYKEHQSPRHAWQYMFVKVKKEIIRMGFPDIRPADFTAEAITPREFKKWLDEKRDITVIDTRNDYEVEQGKFKGALDLRVATFQEFAQKAGTLPDELKEKPVVMYCTGGIRCEKASALFLKHYGFKQVYQLQGGILNYFKDVGGDHYEGDCLVFDRRVSLSPAEEEARHCFKCKAPISDEDHQRPDYIPFESCPSCKNSPSI